VIPIALDELEELIHRARRVPLTDQVRINRDKLSRQIDRIRAGIDREGEPTAALRRLEDAVARAPAVPLTPDVRAERKELLALVEALRAALR
jgi:hypothetical protein